MYKVFVNDIPVIICHLDDRIELNDGTLILAYHGPFDLEEYFKLLYKDVRVNELFITCSHPEEVFGEVKKNFASFLQPEE